MANIYGAAVAELEKPVMHKRLNRQHSRKSVRSNRSSHSVQTPMINRKFNDSHQNTQQRPKNVTTLQPILAERNDRYKHQIQQAQEPEAFDEEKE